MLLSREELDETAVMHPQVAEYLAKNPMPKVDHSTHVASREGLAAMTKLGLERLGPAPPSLVELYHDIPLRDGSKSTLKIQKPANGPAGPLVVLFFGGGFVAGNKDQLTAIGRLAASMFGATVVLPSYRLAPEHKFPTAQLDSWDSMVWIAENATSSLLAADPSKGFIIGGVSAGGSIAAALSRKAQSEKLAHSLTGQWLCIPSVMDAAICPEKYRSSYISFDQNSHAVGLPKEARDMMSKCAEFDTTSDLRYAVLSRNPIAEQPRTFFQVDGMDPLRDDGLIYEEMLKEAGVETKIDLYPGCPHGHFMSVRGVEIADKAMIDMVVGLGWLLNREVARVDAAKLLGVNPA